MAPYIDHVGVVVDDLEAAKQFVGEVLGFEAGRAMELPDRGVKVAFFRCGQTEIELIEVVDAAMRERRLGTDQARIEHIAIGVDDLEAALEKLQAKGVTWTTRELQYVSKSGTTFVMTDPSSSDGVQYQILKRGTPGEPPA